MLSSSIKPQRYRIELIPIPDIDKGRVKLKGRVVIEFTQIGSGESTISQLVLNSRHLTIESHRVVVLGDNNSTRRDDEDGDLRRRDKRESNGIYYKFISPVIIIIIRVSERILEWLCVIHRNTAGTASFGGRAEFRNGAQDRRQ